MKNYLIIWIITVKYTFHYAVFIRIIINTSIKTDEQKNTTESRFFAFYNNLQKKIQVIEIFTEY